MVLEHLIKLRASPAQDPRNGWKTSVRRARISIAKVLKDSPSLRSAVPEMIVEETPSARMIVASILEENGEQPVVAIDSMTFTLEQVLGDWFPDPA